MKKEPVAASCAAVRTVVVRLLYALRHIAEDNLLASPQTIASAAIDEATDILKADVRKSRRRRRARAERRS